MWLRKQLHAIFHPLIIQATMLPNDQRIGLYVTPVGTSTTIHTIKWIFYSIWIIGTILTTLSCLASTCRTEQPTTNLLRETPLFKLQGHFHHQTTHHGTTYTLFRHFFTVLPSRQSIHLLFHGLRSSSLRSIPFFSPLSVGIANLSSVGEYWYACIET